MMVFELQCDLPDHFKRGDQFGMDDDTGMVYMVDRNGKYAEHPLRQSTDRRREYADLHC